MEQGDAGLDASCAIDSVSVLVPAWDEEATVARCVEHLAHAAEAIDPVPVDLTLVADRCTDRTVELVGLAWPGNLRVLDVIAGSAGRARSMGSRTVLASVAGVLKRTWVATTDADSFVPRHWLATQLRYAALGYDGVAGTIDLESWHDLPLDARRRYRRMLDGARRPGGQHADVFAANLGVRASVLAAVGGFPDLPCGEDHAVWDALVDRGFRTVSPSSLVVATSGRLVGRATGGLADLLSDLADSPAEDVAERTSA